MDFHKSRYSFDIVINPPWPDTSPSTAAINTTPVAYPTPLPSLHTRTHDAVDVFIDVPDMPLDDHSDHRNRGHTDVFCDMPGMVVTGRPRVPCHPTLVPMHTGDIRIAEIFAGSGHTSHALHNRGFAPVVYCDVDNQAAEAYADSFPRVPQFRDIRELASARPDIIDAFKSADVVVAGAPCSDHSSLNSRRDPESARSQLIFDAVDHLVAFRNKVGVFEVVPDFLHLMKGELFAKFCQAVSATHTVVPVRMDPREHGGYQTRIRWYLVVIRHDLVMTCGPFTMPARRKGVRTLREVLDSSTTSTSKQSATIGSGSSDHTRRSNLPITMEHTPTLS